MRPSRARLTPPPVLRHGMCHITHEGRDRKEEGAGVRKLKPGGLVGSRVRDILQPGAIEALRQATEGAQALVHWGFSAAGP